MEYIFLTILWVLYYGIHSVLALTQTKLFVKRKAPQYFRFYRLFYSSVAVVTLIPVLLYLKRLNSPYLFQANNAIILIGYIVLISGLVLGFAALKTYKYSDFLGLEQLKNTAGKEMVGRLNSTGLNKYTRHPLYFSVLLLIWGLWLLFPTVSMLITNSVTCIYLIIGIKLEEQKLVVEFGKEYKEYQNNVPMLIPFKLKK